PASSTHRQMTDDELAAAGISPAMVRMSCGIEGTDDLVADVEQALSRA
ncbi:MAG: PLP-dependent transferase, partial [Atopobiaceae bacterium]|nr:PLP-dependent transferase [Atopobiaceae bacterium]